MFEYTPGNSLLHRLDVRTKTAGFALLMLVCFLFKSPWINLCLAGVSALFIGWSGVSPRRTWEKLSPLLPLFVLIALSTAFSAAPTRFSNPESQKVLWAPLSWLQLTSGGIYLGISLCFRIITMVLSTSALIACTPLDDFMQLLRFFKMPSQMAFVLTTAVRFVPTLDNKRQAILDAQRARGAPIGDGGFIDRIKSYLPVMVPLLVESVRMSDHLAVSMLNRGYGARSQSTPLREIHLGQIDRFLLAAIFAAACLGVFCAVRGMGGL